MNNIYLTNDEIDICIKAIDAKITSLNTLKEKLEEARIDSSNKEDIEKKYSEYDKELRKIFNKETFGIDYDLSNPDFFSEENLDKVIKFLTGPSASKNIYAAQIRVERFKDVYLMRYGSIIYGLINDILRKEMA